MSYAGSGQMLVVDAGCLYEVLARGPAAVQCWHGTSRGTDPSTHAADRDQAAPHLLFRAWELRANVHGWDAMYVALAEALQATLITTDARLANVAAIRCRVEMPAQGA
jgi:hypothetical protein